MKELEQLVKMSFGPDTQGKNFIVIRCYCDFEGHGRASETWEEHWELKLPQVPHHYKSTSGWKKGNTDLPIRFHGRTFSEVVSRAKDFLRSCP